MNTAASPNDIVLGRPLRLVLTDGSTRDVVIKPFSTRKYSDLFLQSDDDCPLTYQACGLKPEEELVPASFTEARRVMREVNADFFDYCTERSATLNSRMDQRTRQANEQIARKILESRLSSAAGSSGLPPSAG